MRIWTGILILSICLVGSGCDGDSPGTTGPDPPADLPYGSGYHGSLIVSDAMELDIARWAAAGMAGSDTLTAESPPLVVAGQQLFLHQTRGIDAGVYEFRTVVGVGVPDLVGNCEIYLDEPLAHTYRTGGSDRAQALLVVELTDLTVEAGGELRAPAWDGETGGLLVLFVSGSAVVEAGGRITTSGIGYQGSLGGPGPGRQGEGHPGMGGGSQSNNGNGGGGAYWNLFEAYAGGGGGHGTVGSNSTGSYPASGGETCGGDLSVELFFGGAGGAGAYAFFGGPSTAGSGGGILFLAASMLQVEGEVSCGGARGKDGGDDGGGGGSGAGGSILFVSDSCSLGEDRVTALGAAGIDQSGASGEGRIAVRSPEISGSTVPSYVTVTESLPASRR